MYIFGYPCNTHAQNTPGTTSAVCTPSSWFFLCFTPTNTHIGSSHTTSQSLHYPNTLAAAYVHHQHSLTSPLSPFEKHYQGHQIISHLHTSSNNLKPYIHYLFSYFFSLFPPSFYIFFTSWPISLFFFSTLITQTRTPTITQLPGHNHTCPNPC